MARTSEPVEGTHVVIEANVDDMTGELAAHAIKALLKAGAVDAWATPIVMKKGRPALTLSALTIHGQASAVSETMLRETTSIGVRKTPVAASNGRARRSRIETEFGSSRSKSAEGRGGRRR